MGGGEGKASPAAHVRYSLDEHERSELPWARIAWGATPANCLGCNPRELTAEALRRDLPGVQPPRHWGCNPCPVCGMLNKIPERSACCETYHRHCHPVRRKAGKLTWMLPGYAQGLEEAGAGAGSAAPRQRPRRPGALRPHLRRLPVPRRPRFGPQPLRGGALGEVRHRHPPAGQHGAGLLPPGPGDPQAPAGHLSGASSCST